MPIAVQIYTDGACQGNPGPGGWGAVLIWEGQTYEINGGERLTTNNRMELTAVIRALSELKKPVPVKLYSDSQYVIRGMKEWIHGWKRKGWKRTTGPLENVDLWQELDSIAARYQIEWIWVRGHQGNLYNEKADQLAVAGIPSGT